MLRNLRTNLKRLLGQRARNQYHWVTAWSAAAKYRFPARSLTVFGVTGTKGKTTTTHMLASILEEAGYRVALINGVAIRIAGEEQRNETHKSTLHPAQLQAYLRKAVDAGCDVAVIEVTSIGLDQHRVDHVPFRYAGITNLTHDHLDYHGTMARYREAKLALLRWPRLHTAVVNMDAEQGAWYLDRARAKQRFAVTLEKRLTASGADRILTAERVQAGSTESSAVLVDGDERTKISLAFPGRFSLENAFVAAGMARAHGVGWGTISAGLAKLSSVPGRVERIAASRRGFTVLVDYAHTPDSLERLYSTLRPEVRGKMIAVLGSCGDRDKTKRPIMGALAARFCDLVFLTDEEPYHENPEQILKDIAEGVPRGRALFRPTAQTVRKTTKTILKKSDSGEGDWWWRVADRRSAIKQALMKAGIDDLVVLTGLGAQTSRIVGDAQVPWNDAEVVQELLTELGYV